MHHSQFRTFADLMDNRSRQLTINFFILVLYGLLTTLMTWPTVLHLTDAIPGDGFDGWQNYWNLWWVKEALLVERTTPYYTDYLYPPAGTNLFFHTLNIFNGLWTLPVQMNAGLAVAYNSIVFFSFVFSGYGAYLLSFYTVGQIAPFKNKTRRPAALVGGLIFTMSPFHMAHLLGHMQVFSMMWPPFYILWLLRTLKPWAIQPPARYARRDITLTCLFLILATLIDWYHTLYLILFTGLVVVWSMGGQGRLLKKETRQKLQEAGARPTSANFSQLPLRSLKIILTPLVPVLAIGLGFAVFLSPLLLPMIREAGTRPDLQTGLAQNITLSADLLAFFTPSEMHPLWGKWAISITDNFTSTTSERLIFAGFVPLALAIFAVRRGWVYRPVKFWTLILAFFFVLALGPFLHINGQMIKIGGWPVPLPYLLVYYTVPFIGLTRSLSRYALMVMLSLGILVSVALVQVQAIISRTSSTSYSLQVWVPILIAILICFEFLAVPYPISKIETPQFYADIGTEPERYTLAELPMNWDRPTPLLHQTVHQKGLLTAYTSRNNPRELAWRMPVFQHWRYLAADIIDQPLEVIAPTIFFDFNLRYIVLDYWQMPPGPEREATERWVAAALPNIAPIYEDGRLKVYQSPAKTETQPYLSLGQGWSERQETTLTVSRRFGAAPAELFLHHPQSQGLTLILTAASDQSASLSITALSDDSPIATIALNQTFSPQFISLPPLADDLVQLKLSVLDPADTVEVKKITLHKTSNAP